jgi:hypothetical protein
MSKKGRRKYRRAAPELREQRDTPPSLRAKAKTVSLGVLAVLFTFLIFVPALNNGFVNYDDHKFVYANPHIRSMDAAFFTWAFANRENQWSPLRWVSHAVDYRIWKLDPLGHHLTNILLHALNTLLVFVLVLRLLEAAQSKSLPGPHTGKTEPLLTRALIAGGVTALLFGIHPLRLESAVWVSESKDALYVFFSLISVLRRKKPFHTSCHFCFFSWRQ